MEILHSEVNLLIYCIIVQDEDEQNNYSILLFAQNILLTGINYVDLPKW